MHYPQFQPILLKGLLMFDTVIWYNICMKNRSWYSRNSDEKSPDSIHQILAYGTVKEIQILRKTIGEKALTKAFVENPKKVYTAPSFNFIKKFVLHLSSPLDDQKYLKSTPRYLK